MKLVEELVINHIRGNSLILVALPMTGTSLNSHLISILLTASVDDIDNQKALALAREADPAGKRTIGTHIHICQTLVPFINVMVCFIRCPYEGGCHRQRLQVS